MTPEEKYTLITKDLQEIINDDLLKSKLQDSKNLKCYWGTAPTGSIHIGYLIPFLKIRDIINSGCHMTILVADIHAFLDNLKTPFDKIQIRSQYYILMIKTILKILLNINESDLNNKIKFVLGSDYQLKPEVTLELFKLASITKVSNASKAGTDVVKQTKDPMLTSLLYPLLQALDEYFLDIDLEIGGIDQRKIFAYSVDFMPKINKNKKTIYLMNPIVSGLSSKKSTAEKMSASDPNSKIDLLDSPEIIKKKINKAYCVEGDTDNSVLQLFKNIIFKLTRDFLLERDDKYGGNLNFNSYDELEVSYSEKLVCSADLKQNLSNFLIKYLEPIRIEFNKEENKKLYNDAYLYTL